MKHLQTPPCYIICLLLSCKKVNRTTQRRSEDQLMDRRVFTRILGLHRYLILSLVRPQLHCTLFIIIYKKNDTKYSKIYTCICCQFNSQILQLSLVLQSWTCVQWRGACWQRWLEWRTVVGEFSAIFIKVRGMKFPPDFGFSPFRVNLIDSCFITIHHSGIQNARLVWQILPSISDQRSSHNCTLNIHQIEFAFISQEYFMSII